MSLTSGNLMATGTQKLPVLISSIDYAGGIKEYVDITFVDSPSSKFLFKLYSFKA